MSIQIIAEDLEEIKLDTLYGTGEILTDMRENGKERPWQQHKINSLKLYTLYQEAKEIDEMVISDSRLQSLKECADSLLFEINTEQKKRLKSANFCRLRTCSTCNWRKSLKLFGQVNVIADRVLKDSPTTRFIFATFTVRNCSANELTNCLNSMNEAFKYLTAKSRRFIASAGFKQNLLGNMKAIEITYNSKEDTYHPHFHCIFAVKAGYFTKGYIKKSEWQNIWQQCMKLDYEPIVHVETIKGGTAKAVAEVAKYPIKMDELANLPNKVRAISALITYTKVLRGRRLITFGGIFADVKKILKLEDIDNGDLIHIDDAAEKNGFNPVVQVLYKFNAKVGCYIC